MNIDRYPSLWSREAAAGATEGRKVRPVAMALRLVDPDGDVLLLLPITTKRPIADDDAIEIPTSEKHQGGLDEGVRLWIILDEFNQDVIGRSFDMLPEAPLGTFGKGFFSRVLKAFVAKRAGARGVDRQI